MSQAKMDQETYCLKWKTFSAHLATTFQDLATEGHFTDVTLVSDDQIQMPAHKIVLSACSPVLKSLLLNNPHSHPLLYLRGIKQQQLQYILQFMYFGEATIHQNRINEFMDVALDLEVKELSKDDGTNNDFVKSGEGEEFDNTADIVEIDSYIHHNQTKSVSDTVDELLDLDIPEYNDHTVGRDVMNTSETNTCTDCLSVFTTKQGLQRHTQSKHEGVVYSCNQCQYNATTQGNLSIHQKSKHEGITYSCNQCQYNATTQGHLSIHQQSKHEGITYSCNQCQYNAATQGNLKIHQQSKHEGITYSCNRCHYKATQQSSLRRHQQSKHEGMTYSCNQCEYQTGWPSHLRKHKSVKHSSI